MDDIVIYLLKLEARMHYLSKLVDAIHYLTSTHDPSLPEPSTKILDIMGFPEDNTLEINDPDDPRIFARDYCDDIILEGIRNQEDPAEIFRKLKVELKKLDNVSMA